MLQARWAAQQCVQSVRVHSGRGRAAAEGHAGVARGAEHIRGSADHSSGEGAERGALETTQGACTQTHPCSGCLFLQAGQCQYIVLILVYPISLVSRSAIVEYKKGWEEGTSATYREGDDIPATHWRHLHGTCTTSREGSVISGWFTSFSTWQHPFSHI